LIGEGGAMKTVGISEHELAFWLRHVRIGVTISQATLIVSLVYLYLDSQNPRQTALFALVGVTFAVTTAVAMLPLRRILARGRAAPFFAAWSGTLTLIVLTATLLDGGGQTPLMLLYFMPLVYGATAYPPRGVIALGVLVVGAAVASSLAGAAPPRVTLLLGALLTLVTVMCAVIAENHWRVQRAQAALARRLGHLAQHDGLTGCLNHRAFHALVESEAERAARYDRPLALLMLDLDGFKTVNDLHGHACGDAVLAAVARTLLETVRDSDSVGRVGGDEFAVLLPETQPPEAALLAERLRMGVGAIREPLGITVSVGVSGIPSAARDAAGLLAHADAAVYEAKRAGRDLVAVSGQARAEREPAGIDENVRERVLEVVDGGRLSAVFQPVVSLADGSVLGYEALSRVDASNLGPAQWLDLAEQVGLGGALEAAMWRAALLAGPPPNGSMLFLNASPSALLSGALDCWRGRLPAETAIEVSEHHAIRDYAVLSRDLAHWVDGGCRVAVDDMGAGHANLAHVLNLAPHYLKLDRSLVAGLHLHPARIALLESLLTFASRMGSRIIAEGVETEEEAAALTAVGVRFAQGHLFARPAPAWPRVDWRPPLIESGTRGVGI
jgi:diguanylate cyclase (GGDEF)-like protein